MSDDFEAWYRKNLSYYQVKHNGDVKAMKDDALSAYAEIQRFSNAPAEEQKKGRVSKKPNPYGFK